MSETQNFDDPPQADWHSTARFNLEIRALEQGVSPEQQFRSEMEAAGVNVVSDGTENGRRKPGFLARVASAIIGLS